ncbi:MAG: S9 family peptidase [Phycisphaerales bacterium]|nr:S9 family peptidase [Phycisphaerales bacterium]
MITGPKFRAGAFLLAAGIAASIALAQPTQPTKLAYPAAPTGTTVDDYHGTKVADPYRWMEEYSDQTNKWIEDENKITFAWLASIPERESIHARLKKVWNYEKYGLPGKEGGKYFFSKNDGLQNQSVLYVTNSLNDTPRVLLDPNTLSKDGTVSLSGTSVSDDGKLIAYGVSDAGSDWNIWHIRDIDSGKDLSDELRWVKFSGASWSKDNKGFYYSRYDAPADEAQKLKSVNEYHKIYYHLVGTPQDQDKLIYERKDQPKWYLGSGVTEDGKYLIISANAGDTVNDALFYKDLTKPNSPVVELFNKFDAKYSFVGNDDGVFYIQSDLEAPRGRIWAIDTAKPDRANWKELIPQATNALQGAGITGNRFFLNYLNDAKTQVKIFDMSGKFIKEVQFPGICSAGGFGGKRTDTETFYSFSGYTTPPSIFHYDIATDKSTLFKAPKVDINPDNYETKQVFYKSKDGTKIPMFITSKKGIKLDGSNPTLLYAYGGFNISITPGFSPASTVWLDMGGIYAVANLRGGGEYGEEWHQGGMKLVKQNVFDDFIAAAQYLIDNKYTSTPKLAIQGGSNGGLLVGACMTQRPDLFGACLPAVGVMDMLRFQKFTIGWGWVGDYGTSDKPDEFKALHAYSPYHNIKKGTCYPPTLVTTADHDDRVYPAHSFKFAAAMQAAQSCDNPILIRIETRAGHGAGKPTSKRIDEAADIYAFLVKTLNVKVN